MKTTNTTNVAASIAYADGSGLSGVVDFAELVIGGYTVPSQGASFYRCHDYVKH